MLFNELDKVRRHIIMMAILFIFAGIALIEVPDEYLNVVASGFGFVLLVWSVVTILEFVERPKVLIAYLKLFAASAALLLGFAVLVFEGFVLWLLAALTGVLPIFVGIVGIYYALVFARRSGRRGWAVPMVLSILLILFGFFVIFNPWSYDLGAEQDVIGGALTYSAFMYAMLLAWIWPTPAQEER